MIEKMTFLTITGPRDEIDRVLEQYLSRYEMQLENALSQLRTVQNLKPFLTVNPYREPLASGEELLQAVSVDGLAPQPITPDAAIARIDEIQTAAASLRGQNTEIEAELKHALELRRIIAPFQNLDYDISRLLQFTTIKVRFGRIEREYSAKFEKYVYDKLDSVFYKCSDDDTYVYGVCFLPAAQEARIDAVYSSLHFERIYISDDYEGTPRQAVQTLDARIRALSERKEAVRRQTAALLDERRQELFSAVSRLRVLSENYDVRKLAAVTEGETESFILCGWMSERDAAAFLKEVENDKTIFCTQADTDYDPLTPPPTKLKNPRILRPFQMFTEMYGLPAYNEFDPTVFLALTYPFIFGWMFGDVGQGLVLAIGGFLLYRFRKMRLAGIIGFAGIFSTLFGFLFGSFFGFEDVIPALWMRPIDQLSTIPFIGKLNTVFLFAIGYGMFLILVVMVLHILNGIREKNRKEVLFNPNGLAGLIFYGSLVGAVALLLTGHALPGTLILVLMFGVPLLLIAFQDPISRLLLKTKEETQSGPVMTLVQAFFDLFEVLLSYFSNTISFIRIGAYAISHAAMMQVVLSLAGAESGNPNWIVIVLGNLVVCLMEGLIVGIQVLRLEYYELFSRFYKGTGRAFEPFRSGKSG